MLITDLSFLYKGNKILKSFIDKKVYEPFLLSLLVQIPEYGNLIIQKEQSHSEDDFIDLNNGHSYEATLLINDGIFSKIFSNQEYIYSDKLQEQRTNDVISVFKDSLNRKKNKQTNIILFNIFPDLFPKYQGAITEKWFYDETDLLFQKILSENVNLLENKTVILISYNIDDTFYLRTLYERKDDLAFIDKYDQKIFPFKVSQTRVSFY